MKNRFHADVGIPIDNTFLSGELTIPANARAIVIFSHGSGSSRFSSRNQAVAKYLQENLIGTLLFDLLTAEEDRIFQNRFNIDLLTKRLVGATEWLERFPAAKNCGIGYFGASTGAASALKAAAILPSVKAIVCRGGRPDLATDVLFKVAAPTLLIVGGLDPVVLDLNQQAYQKLECPRKMEIIEGASHLFEEPGKMEIVSRVAATWFERYLFYTPVNK